MHHKLVVTSVLLIFFTLVLFFPMKLKTNRKQINSIKVETVDKDSLIKLMEQKLKRKKSTLFKPINPKQIKLLQNALSKDDIDLNKLQLISSLTPYKGEGLSDILPLPKNPLETQVFQFENGESGWFWSYGTFAKEKTGLDHDYNYMYYIVRLELGNEKLRKLIQAPLGGTTVYLVSLGFGKNQNWLYNPLTITQGTVENLSSKNFTFKSQHDNETNVDFKYKDNKFIIDYSFNDEPTKQFCRLKVESSNDVIFFNGKKGCLPCVGGLGTNYWSYTNLKTNITNIELESAKSVVMTQSEKKRLYEITDGVGWMDKQWSKLSMPNTIAIRIITNITRMTKKIKWGLGKYVWLNINVSDNLQYMIYGFPKDDLEVKNGSVIKNAIYNIYNKNEYPNAKLNNKTNIEILDTVLVEEEYAFTKEKKKVIYPIKYKVILDNVTYIIDASDFGKCVTYDQSNNFHWAGSAKVYDETGTGFKGTGFIEAAQFQDFDDYANNIVYNAGIPTDNKDLFVAKLPFLKSLPSILVILFYITIFILFFVFLLKRKR